MCSLLLTMTLSAQTLTACYWGDIQLVDPNEPPWINESTTNDPILVIDQEEFSVYVAAQDDIDDVLIYLWTKDNEVIPDAIPFVGGSQVYLTRSEPGLSGKVLRVSVYDSEGASTSQSWVLEVP